MVCQELNPADPVLHAAGSVILQPVYKILL